MLRRTGVTLVFTLYSASSAATTGLSSVAGLNALADALMLLLSVVVGLLLLLAYRLRKKHGKIGKAVIGLAGPALLFCIYTYRAVFSSRADMGTLLIVLLSVVFGVFILRLFIEDKSIRTKAVSAFVIIAAAQVLMNPAMFNFWNYTDVENDPFDGKGVKITNAVEVGAYVEEAWGKTDDQRDDRDNLYVQHVLVLDDGRHLPGIFPGLENIPFDEWPEVIVEKEMIDGSYPYPYQVVAYAPISRPDRTPLFSYPIFDREYLLNKTYVIGSAYKVSADSNWQSTL